MKSHGAKYKKKLPVLQFLGFLLIKKKFEKIWKKNGKKIGKKIRKKLEKKSGKSEDVVLKKKKGAGVKKGLSALNLISGKIIYLIR